MYRRVPMMFLLISFSFILVNLNLTLRFCSAMVAEWRKKNIIYIKKSKTIKNWKKVKIWSNLAKTDPFFSLRRQVNEAEWQAKRVDNFVISLKNQELLVIHLFGPDTFIIFLSFFLAIPLFGAICLLGTREYVSISWRFSHSFMIYTQKRFYS